LIAGRLHDTAGPSQIKEIPAYSGVAQRKRVEPSRGVAATRLYAERIPKSENRNSGRINRKEHKERKDFTASGQ
jgi:hypothetical protein